MIPIDSCGTCRFAHYRPELDTTECRIRSVAGPFPERSPNDWCGEYRAAPVVTLQQWPKPSCEFSFPANSDWSGDVRP